MKLFKLSEMDDFPWKYVNSLQVIIRFHKILNYLEKKQ